MLSIIIPVLNEEDVLANSFDYYKELSDIAQVIFVDGGSADQTFELASKVGKVIVSSTGRSVQKNCGAQAADHSNLLFVHVDTFVSLSAISSIQQTLNDPNYWGGCLTLSINDDRPIFRLFEWAVNVRTKYFSALDGDCGLFIRKDTFMKVGGFDHRMRIMEDIAFFQRVKEYGEFKVLSDTINVSSRKWDEEGFIQTMSQYSLNYLRYWTGMVKS